MNRINQLAILLLLSALAGSEQALSQLIDNGDGTISDVDQQIMWMKDAGDAPSKLFTEAQDWVNQKNADAYAGYTDWRLPSGTDVRSDPTATSDDGQYFYNATGSEFGYLFYVHLNGKSGCHVTQTGDQYGIGCSYPNDDPDLLLFDNIPPSGNFNATIYWTGMASASSPGYNWTFAFGSGLYREQPIGETRRFRGWAVRDAVIPVPQCNDGTDNDADGLIDTADPGCANTADNDESDDPVTQCTDGIDNDDDGYVDLEDANCCGVADDDEQAHFSSADGDLPQCSDGLDNDDDCSIDYPDDSLCRAADDPSESMRCTRFFFFPWICLMRIAWPVAIGFAVLAFGVAYYVRRARKRREDG